MYCIDFYQDLGARGDQTKTWWLQDKDHDQDLMIQDQD